MYNIMAGKYRIQNTVIKRLNRASYTEEIHTKKQRRYQVNKGPLGFQEN